MAGALAAVLQGVVQTREIRRDCLLLLVVAAKGKRVRV
jgi:hypothetical protein